MKKYGFILLAIFILLGVLFFAQQKNDNSNGEILFNETVDLNDSKELSKFEQHKIFPEVWSQNSPYGESYEFKVNCFGDYVQLKECFLWDIDSVRVISPNLTIYNLNKDFNINNYSGETTRRWVLYGPYNSSLPTSGNYTFQFIKHGSLIVEDIVEYDSSLIGYPKNVDWKRRGRDLYVSWTPLFNMADDMFYKVIVWEEYGTPDVFVSDRFDWNVTNATLPNVPLINGGNYSVNVAVYFKDGYAFSEYVKFQW